MFVQRFLKVLKWIASHIVVKVVNLNDDKEAKPRGGVVVGIKGKL